MIQKETYELLEPLINALPTTIYITNVVDNNDGTFTIYTNSTLHLQASNRVLNIDGNDYVVTEVVNNTSIKVTGTEPIIVDNFEIYPVKFWHGTQIRTNIELKDVSPLSEDKFPCVWLYEVLREKNNYDETSSIGRTVDLRLYFLTETDFINKDNEQRYTDAVKPMRNAYHYFLEVLEQAGAVVGEIEDAETTPYPIFGRESEAGIVANIFNHNLGGLGVRITIPFKNSYCCCDELNNFVADFINNNINTAKQLICQTLPECGTIIDLDDRVTALEQGGGGGGLSCNDLSNCQTIIDLQNNKVDKEVGKGLSTNDLTNALKSNYDTAYSQTHTHANKTILDAIQEALTTALKTAYDSTVTWISTNGTNILNHIASTSNPHSVTKAQVGLGNVDNTSDANKPISTAQATAFGKQRFTIYGRAPQFSPADNTNYYIGAVAGAVTTASNQVELSIPINCTLRELSFNIRVAGTLGSAENIPVKLLIDGVESSTVGNIKMDANTTTNKYFFSGLNISANQNQLFQVKIECPAFATNPTNVIVSFNAYFEPTI